MHSHGVCSRTEVGIRCCPYFSARSCSWALGRHLLQEAVQLLFWKLDFGDGFASLQFDAITPTLLRVEASSDVQFPLQMIWGWTFCSPGAAPAPWHRDIPVLRCSHTHTCAGMCSLMSQHTRKGKFMFYTQPVIPASLKPLKTHQFQVSKSAP